MWTYLKVSESDPQQASRREPWTYCGARPKSNAEKTRDMTPKKKLIFSRVRTTLADCHAVPRDAMRFETCGRLQLTRKSYQSTYLEL
jgi:hypothetical protein